MKKIIYNLALATTMLAGTIFTGCQSSTEKVDAAQTEVKDAKQDLEEAKQKEAVEKQKAADAEEWKTFKIESEAKIKANEVRIDEQREKMKTSGKTVNELRAKKIDALEQRNKDLKAKIEAYEKNQSDWETFKREFNHDMEGLGEAFNDLGTDNKK
jgi:outer membrane murein-binding lipoprotein Lpp